MIFRGDKGTEVATVDGSGHVRLKPIEILLDTGVHVQIAGSLSPEDRIIVNPADSLDEGDEVKGCFRERQGR